MLVGGNSSTGTLLQMKWHKMSNQIKIAEKMIPRSNLGESDKPNHHCSSNSTRSNPSCNGMVTARRTSEQRIRRNSRFRMTRRQRGCHSKESCFVKHHLSVSILTCNTRDHTSTRGRLQRSDVISTAVQHPGIRLTF